MCQFSFFVPVYNEEKVLKKNVLKLNDYLNFLKISYELFIIDDASDDSTSIMGRELESRISNVKYIRHNIGPSKRENLAQSFRIARGRIIIFLDADLATDIRCIRELI